MSNQEVAQKVILSFDTARYVFATTDPWLFHLRELIVLSLQWSFFSDMQPLTPTRCVKY